MKTYLLKFTVTQILCLLAFLSLYAQTELAPWGNITGIRIDGQLIRFETNLSVVRKGGKISATQKERQRPRYTRNGNTQTVFTRIDSLYLTETVTDTKKGSADLSVKLEATAAMPAEGVYLCLILPGQYLLGGRIRIGKSKALRLPDDSARLSGYLDTLTGSLKLTAPGSRFSITFQDPEKIMLKAVKDPSEGLRLYIPLAKGDLKNGQSLTRRFSIHASGKVDQKEINLVLDTSHPGRKFEGIGGNFRLQNPKEDPKVIDYCLKNLRVAFGRVEMPWSEWQPDENTDPVATARSGKLNPHVVQSMKMAQRLYQMGVPVILTAWFPPAWAVKGALKFKPGPDGVWGNQLDHTKTNKIYQSIADYIAYLKEAYGVRIADFSFNESDLGINIRQTAEEHDQLIKGLGAYFASRGLKTKLLLGDNSDATTYRFIDPALKDTAARRYIGAISFHSWRGWEEETLKKWADAATRLGLPLIVGEGSIDAQAWGYPEIFEEPTYALKEINLYVRLLSICQPESILQWQFTSDYSLLAGGGIYGNNAPFHPTQRFWDIKQLGATPKGLRGMSLMIRGNDVSGAALGDNQKKTYCIHLVNNGATRRVSLTGLPAGISSFRLWITDKSHSMQEEPVIRTKNGTARFILKATSYTTLLSN